VNPVRWGLLPVSNIANRAFIPAIRRSEHAEAYAVASRDAEKAVAFAAANGLARHCWLGRTDAVAPPAIVIDAPGVAHCGGGDGPQPQGLFEALVNWVEQAKAPNQLLAAKTSAGRVTQTRPLCPYPALARWTGTGSTDDAANFVCGASFCKHLFDPDDSEEAGERE